MRVDFLDLHHENVNKIVLLSFLTRCSRLLQVSASFCDCSTSKFIQKVAGKEVLVAAAAGGMRSLQLFNQTQYKALAMSRKETNADWQRMGTRPVALATTAASYTGHVCCRAMNTTKMH